MGIKSKRPPFTFDDSSVKPLERSPTGGLVVTTSNDSPAATMPDALFTLAQSPNFEDFEAHFLLKAVNIIRQQQQELEQMRADILEYIRLKRAIAAH